MESFMKKKAHNQQKKKKKKGNWDEVRGWVRLYSLTSTNFGQWRKLDSGEDN